MQVHLQRRTHSVFAAGLLEGAKDQRAATALLHVVGQILTCDVRGAALIRTLHGKTRAVELVVLRDEKATVSIDVHL